MQRLSFFLAARQAQRSIAAYVLRFTAASHDSVACEECSPQPIKGDRERYTLYNSHRRVVLDMMEEQLMIAAVAAHRSLYDPSHSKYKDTELRSAIWQQIAKDLSMEVDVCKAKWRTLRDGFTRALRQQKECRNGASSKSKKPWRYQNEMEFLMPFISPRESRATLVEKDGDEDHEITGQTQSPTNCSGCNDGDIDDDESTRHSSGSITTTTTTPQLIPKFEVTASHGGNLSEMKRKSDTPSPDLFVDYLKYRRLNVDLLLKKHELASSIKRDNVCSCKHQEREEDPVEAFFFSMGQSVKRLPFHLQARVKMKVCQAVTDAELECLDTASV